MSYFTYTNNITNGISADGANVMTNFNDVRASLIDGTKDLNIAALACTTLAPSSNVTLSNQTASTVLTLSAAKVITSSSVLATQLKIMTNWGDTVWTPTGGWTATTTYTGSFRRVGDTGQYRVNIAISGLPTGNATTLIINLPANNTIDTTKLPGATAKQIALDGIGGYWDDSASNSFPIQVFYDTTTTVALYVGDASGTFLVNTGLKNARPATYSANDAITLYFSVPIVEYA